MENKDIVEALEQVPALVKAAETFKATSGHIVSSLADAVKQRPQAEIPESELLKIFKGIGGKGCRGYRVHHQRKS